MSDEPALLRAIADAPDDLHLRLVYADWCEEHGRDARSALIRGQCMLDPVLERAVGEDSRYDPDPRYLAASQLPRGVRESVLAPFQAFAEAAGLDWDGPSGFLSVHNHQCRVRRGFTESLTLQSLDQLRAWLKTAEHVHDLNPLLELQVGRGWPENEPPDPQHLLADLLADLLAVKGISRLDHLNLEAFSLEDSAARTLLDHAAALHLIGLHLAHRGLPEEMITALRERFGTALHLRDVREDDIPF